MNSGDNCEEGSFNQQMKQLSSKAKDVKKKLKNDVLAFPTKKDRVIYLQANSGLWVGLTDEYGCSALHLAVQNKSFTVVQSLLLAGADINVPEGCGVTPIMVAVNNNQPEMVKILVEYGAIWHLKLGTMKSLKF